MTEEVARLVTLVEGVTSRYGARIAYRWLEESGDPEEGPSVEEANIDERLARALRAVGVGRLYRFQYAALDRIRSDSNVVIVSGTGTGKTEAFMVPILDMLLREGLGAPRPYAIVMYPTKALARDQLGRLRRIAEVLLGYRVAVLDGDTPKREREEIYTNPPHILVTNPDMMHVGLAFSDNIRRLVSRARVLVLDEMHVYKGVFGAHVKWVIHRMKSISRNGLQFIGAGATIGNPRELGEILFGEEVEVVEGPRRRKGIALHVMIEQGPRASRWTLAAALIAGLAREGFKVLGFVDSQQMAELIARIAVKSFGVRVGVHRAGLLPEDRRRIEREFWEGRLRAVVATPTLELGIDVGDLDAVVMPHLPRSYASYIQRAGRAGRRGRLGLVATILGDDPIESYFLARPREYFSQEVDPSYVDPSNIEVAKTHLAALLLQRGVLDPDQLPLEFRAAAKELEAIGVLRRINSKLYPDWRRAREYLEARRSLRAAGLQVRIVESGRIIGYREMPQALYDLYPGAIYYHAGRTMVSLKLDLAAMRAEVREVGAQVGIYTKPLYKVDLIEVAPHEAREVGPLKLVYGDLKLAVYVEGYVVREEYSGALLTETLYDEPITWTYWTKGVITRYPSPSMLSDHIALASGYHALEHALIAAARPVVGASDTDLGGISYPSGHIVIYDSAPGGHGASRLVYSRFERIQDMAFKILGGCRCDDGCPRCVFSPYCGNGNRFLSRRTALEILSYTLQLRGRIKEEPPQGEPIA